MVAANSAVTAPTLNPVDPGDAKLSEPVRLIVLPTPLEPPAPGSSVENAGQPPSAVASRPTAVGPGSSSRGPVEDAPPAPAPARPGPGKSEDTPPAQVPALEVVIDEKSKTSKDEKPDASKPERPVAPVEGPARSDEAIPSAAPAAEDRPPLEIAELHLCRKVTRVGVLFKPISR